MAGPNLATNRTTASTIAEHVADHNAAHNVANKIDKDATPVTGDALVWNGSVYVPVAAAFISPLTYLAVGDGVANDSTAFANMLTAAPVGSVIDLGGKTYLLATTWNITKQVEIRNGTLTAAGRRVALINAADVTCRDVYFNRTTSALGSDDGSAVFVQGLRYLSIDCDYRSSARQPLRMGHAVANGTTIRGGTCYPEVAYADVAGIYVNAGATGNLDILIERVTVQGNGSSTNGISIYDSSRCTVRNCVVDTATMLPEISWVSSGWALVSGNIYSRTDRTDGGTRAVFIGATEYTENTSTPTTPGSNQWGVSGGTLYLNLGGTDPNTQTVISRIVSGYGIMFYSSTDGYLNMSDNRVEHCRIRNTDGFGIYLQLDDLGASRNGTLNNILTNVCLKGRQSTKLPFAAIGVGAGTDTSLIGDTIDTVGNGAFLAPGLRISPDQVSFSSSGVVVGMQVRGATDSGITFGSGQWKFIGCRANNNGDQGFEVWNNQSTDVVDVELISCQANNNAVHGVLADASIIGGSTYRVSIIGGLYYSNTSRNIMMKGVRSSKIVGPTCHSPGAGAYNIVLDGSINHVILDDITLYSGNGINIVTGVGTDIALGLVTSDVTTATQLTLGTGVVVRTGGTTTTASRYMGVGTPEGAVTAVVGSMYQRTDGGAGTSIYVKESGTGNTGWVGK